MKTTKIHFVSINEKELFFKIVLLSTLTVGIFSNQQGKKNSKVQAIVIKNVYNDQYGDFDRAPIPNKPPVIAKMISVLKPQLEVAQKKNVADKIHQALTNYDIAPQIMVAIIDAESDFRQDAVSSTGDLSMAQINPEVWNKEFERMNLEPIDIEKLKYDEAYSLLTMTRILHILKTRYGKTDRRWYARYHSGTKKYKRAYLAKLETRMQRLEKSNLVLPAMKSMKPRLVALQ